MRALLLVALALAVVASPAQAQDPWTDGPEVGTQPGLYESYDEAAAYWSTVPGVPTIAEACGPPPQIFLVVNDPENAAYGSPKIEAAPCKIWFEEATLKATDTMAPWMRDRARCWIVVHEIGHALGLKHQDYGDPQKVMLPGGTAPAPCKATYEPPKAMEAPQWTQTLCFPSWAAYGPTRVFDLYVAYERRAARRAFKRWAKRNRREARQIRRLAAVCL